MQGLGVVHRVISTAHPRANGLVERYNRVVKEGLRKLATLSPAVAWDELLPEVLAGLRMLPTKVGWSPHLLCFKQPATWLGPVVGGVSEDADVSFPTASEAEELLGQQLLWWEHCLGELRQRLLHRDEAMQRGYAARLGVDEL